MTVILGNLSRRSFAVRTPCTRHAPRKLFMFWTVPPGDGAPSSLIARRRVLSISRLPWSVQNRGASIPAPTFNPPFGTFDSAWVIASLALSVSPISKTRRMRPLGEHAAHPNLFSPPGSKPKYISIFSHLTSVKAELSEIPPGRNNGIELLSRAQECCGVVEAHRCRLTSERRQN